MLHRSRALGLIICLVLILGSWPAFGVPGTVKIVVDAGTTELSLWDETIVIWASAEVMILLEYVDGEVGGAAIPVPDSDGIIYVEIIVLGPPDKVVFDGEVDGPTPFESVQPHETGHSEN